MDREALLNIQRQLKEIGCDSKTARDILRGKSENGEQTKLLPNYTNDELMKQLNNIPFDKILISFGQVYSDDPNTMLSLSSIYLNLENGDLGEVSLYDKNNKYASDDKIEQTFFSGYSIIRLKKYYASCEIEYLERIRQVLCEQYYKKAITSSQEDAKHWITTSGVADKIIERDKGLKLERGI